MRLLNRRFRNKILKLVVGGLLHATEWNAIHETLGRSNSLSLEAPELLHGSFLLEEMLTRESRGEKTQSLTALQSYDY